MPDDVRVRVLSDRRASPDRGEHFHNYVAGEVYGPETDPPMPADLAVTFLRERWGEDASRVRVHEEPAEPAEPAAAACLWCGAAYARRATGGQPQKFCSSACRRACHTAARRWAVLELEAGRLTVANVLGQG